MELLIEILERKNLCLRSFHALCEKFLGEIAKDKADDLEEFQRKRQGLIHVLEELEAESNKLLGAYNSNPSLFDSMLDETAKDKITRQLKTKDSTIKAIVDLDLQILVHIDRIKNETIQKLNALQNGRRFISAYRSPIDKIEHAEGMTLVDREA